MHPRRVRAPGSETLIRPLACGGGGEGESVDLVGSHGRLEGHPLATRRRCSDASDCVVQVLRDMEGDEDAAMEALIAAPEPEPSSSPRADVSSGDRGEDSGCVEEAGGTSTATEPPEEEVVEVEVVVQKAERKKSKAVDPTETPKPNGRCTCGSKKKFKACCGTCCRPRPTPHRATELSCWAENPLELNASTADTHNGLTTCVCVVQVRA